MPRRSVRRILHASLGWSLLVVTPLLPAQKRPEPRPALRIVPTKVYKVDDAGHAETEIATFNAVVMCNQDDCSAKPANLRLELYSGALLVGMEEFPEAALEKMTSRAFAFLKVLRPRQPAEIFC